MNKNLESKQQETQERVVVKLPCDHDFEYELYSISTVRQIVMGQHPYCIECREEYKSNQSELIKALHTSIQDEKTKIKKVLENDPLTSDEKKTLINFRKIFYLYKLEINKPNIEHIDLIIQMFNTLFDTVYLL